MVANISQETTFRELGAIEGVTEDTRRTQGINLSGGHTNAAEFCVNMFGVPDFMTLLDAYEGRAVPSAVATIIHAPGLNHPHESHSVRVFTDASTAIYPEGYQAMMDDESSPATGAVQHADREAVAALFEASTRLGIDPEIIAQTLEYANSDVEENAFNDEAAFT